MRFALILIFGLIISSVFPCRANVGDTIDQCIARYGKRLPPSGMSDPSRLGGEAALFQKDGYNIEVFLFDGVVACESISKTDGAFFSEEERNKIVQMETSDESWAKPITAHGQLCWMKSDGALIFCYQANTPLILEMSKHYLDLTSKAKKNARPFPSEAEVRKNIVPGMSEEDVIKKYGVPYLRTPSSSGGEDLDYIPPPFRTELAEGYGGFEVFVKKGKVTDLKIVLRSERKSH